MKVLVTGAKGFIGKHVTLQLKRKGHEVFEKGSSKKLEMFYSSDIYGDI